ncbi:AAEL017337-PA [Aedes aegypti]|uniref:AAEL017337-PA n=1 Tax=Aedes aegypti TaxID=7159 RepID=J9HTG7_AEDAE|nr:AAEL017337-PA [Aedes aegypti]
MTLEGKAAVVIGGTGGIGVEICKKLLSSGISKLAILDVNELSPEAIANIASCNPTAELVSARCDITNKLNLEDVIRFQVMEKFGYIDLLVNSAGTVDERDPGRLIAINLDDLIYKRTGVKCITICPGITDTTLLSKFFAGEDLLFPWMDGIATEVKKNYPSQSPSAVGECIVKAVSEGENGSVWIVNGGLSYKLDIPANQFVQPSSTETSE